MNFFEYMRQLKKKKFYGRIVVQVVKGQIEEVEQTHKLKGEITDIPVEQDNKTKPS